MAGALNAEQLNGRSRASACRIEKPDANLGVGSGPESVSLGGSADATYQAEGGAPPSSDVTSAAVVGWGGHSRHRPLRGWYDDAKRRQPLLSACRSPGVRGAVDPQLGRSPCVRHGERDLLIADP